MRKRPLLLCCLLALAQPLAAAAASVPAGFSDPVPPGGFYGGDEYILITNGMYGWGFLLTEPATVTGLAWYDQNPAGLSHDHQVGLWQYAGGPTNWTLSKPNNLLFSLTIPPGTNAALLNGAWRKVDLAAPVALPAAPYMLAGTYHSENPDVVKFVNGPPYNSVLPIDPRIMVEAPAFTDSGSYSGHYDPNAPLFRIPDDILLLYGFEFGPNLLLVPPVPSLQVSASANQIVLSWPLWATNFVLETSAAAGPAASWTATTNAAAVSGHSLVATNPMSTPSAFYRLRQR
jgi:hypothetical protein